MKEIEPRDYLQRYEGPFREEHEALSRAHRQIVQEERSYWTEQLDGIGWTAIEEQIDEHDPLIHFPEEVEHELMRKFDQFDEWDRGDEGTSLQLGVATSRSGEHVSRAELLGRDVEALITSNPADLAEEAAKLVGRRPYWSLCYYGLVSIIDLKKQAKVEGWDTGILNARTEAILTTLPADVKATVTSKHTETQKGLHKLQLITDDIKARRDAGEQVGAQTLPEYGRRPFFDHQEYGPLTKDMSERRDALLNSSKAYKAKALESWTEEFGDVTPEQVDDACSAANLLWWRGGDGFHQQLFDCGGSITARGFAEIESDSQYYGLVLDQFEHDAQKLLDNADEHFIEQAAALLNTGDRLSFFDMFGNNFTEEMLNNRYTRNEDGMRPSPSELLNLAKEDFKDLVSYLGNNIRVRIELDLQSLETARPIIQAQRIKNSTQSS